MVNPRALGWRGLVLGAVSMLALSLSLSACGTPGAAETGARESPGASGDFGTAEQTELTVAIPFPDTSFMAFMVAIEEEYFADEGLTIKELVTVDDTRAALVSASADIASVDAAGAYSAVAKGLGITVIGGNFCREQFAFAAQPEIKSVEDLAGQDVILTGAAGDTIEFENRKVLKEAGWDLDKVGVNPVYIGYDSAQWVQFFVADRIALTWFFSEDKPVLVNAGAMIIVDEVRPWPNNVLMARKDWVAENPNTARRFLRAMMRAVDFVTAPKLGEPPENWDRILEIVQKYGYKVDDLRQLSADKRVYVLGEYLLCQNMYYDAAAWNLTIENQQLKSVPFADGANIEALLSAQKSLGHDNSPPGEIPWTPTPAGGY